ncbi:p-loop containing nucleoside triphosphate hydrolase protein [Moesziomyces antarcticus]|uniref:p-loop containing nucleoside triphosphate hydrolase protein n=2 Tax=Pseudozyma antarctica TaxID=84753 RepID=A0A081CFA0_PSEA2|nr:p-loop containing nucleoside triphosphate hydrolase protein [Moesziomyces antarcticus]GAK65346.1 p-loop containing nucleoside triphosphate hydrolase protein [Moesziomyces antarcticus]SPO46351.1 related to HRQ1 - putative RecQ helicase [Moesziomyces antarcticus]
MPKLIRKGQRILHNRTQARLNGSTLPTISRSTDADDAEQLDSDEEQPLFLGRASATPAPADDSPFARWDVPKDPTELPSETRRKAASRRVADAVENARLRSLNQTSSRQPNPAGHGASHSNGTIPQAKQEETANLSDDDPVLASPTLAAHRSRDSTAHVKNEPEVIEIKSEDDDDGEDDFQIVSPPPRLAASATPPPRITPVPPALESPTTPPPVAQRQATAAARNRRSATASAASSSSATRQALVGRQPSVAPSDASRTQSEAPQPPEKPVLERKDPWPDHFLELEKTFRAINTVYSFCSARKHMATTYDTIKSSVEGLTKKPLQIFEIAQIKSLCGDLIHFAYVEHDMLQVHMDSRSNAEDAASNTVRPPQKSRLELRDEMYQQAAEAIADGDPYIPDDQTMSVQSAAAAAPLAVDAAGFDATGGGFQDVSDAHESGGPHGPLLPPTELEVQQLQRKGKQRARDEYVLLFEFNDGTLQGPKATARGGRAGMRRAPNRDAADPTGRPKPKPKRKLYSLPSTASMMKLINKRNFKFEQAVLELLAACSAKDEDPVQLLIDAAHDHVPLNPETASRTEGDTPHKKRIRLEFLMKNPEHRPSIASVIEEMSIAPWWKDQIVPGGHKVFDQRPAKMGELNYLLSQAVVNALYATHGIEQLYAHQAEALNALHERKNVIVSTSTSSGKSLIYQLPVLGALEHDGDATAMFIFPTKALAQDQRRSLQDLIANCEGVEGAIVATYDGDTDKHLRKDIRERASVIFTNPDMLHQSILPSEDVWRRFLRNLRYVVVDELHIYNGLFGAHVSFIMRRLRRICSALGNRDVQFVSCSATVANPREHMQTLFGVDDVHVVTEDGSPAGRKEWLVWNPPLIDDTDPAQGRVSSYAEVSKVFRHLIQRGVRTIVFTKVRRTCEIVMRQVRNDLLLEDRPDVANKVMSYRSGYSPQDRRKIEQDMFKGALLGIVATSALELGIDIGSLDAVIMLGFPYSISSLRQQAGRAGRRQKDSLAVLIGDPWPMDQHYMHFPDEIFLQPDAALSVDLGNDFILESHLQCAAEEMPITVEDDEQYFGAHLATLCQTRLEADGSGFFYCREELRPNPARDVAIRGARQESYCYIDDTPGRAGGAQVMEEVEMERAIFEAFEGAVFMHQGLSYICRDIDHDARIARMVQADVNYHTRPRDHTDTDAMETYRIRRLRESPYLAYYGKVTIASYVWGYFKVDRRANILDAVEVDCPPFVRHTRGLWIDVPTWLVEAMTDKRINAAAAIHAAEHALLSLTPMFVVSVAGDVRTECKIAEKEYAARASSRKRPARLIFYDMPGQNGGVCAKAFEHLDGLIRIAISVIEACACNEGCPSCVTSQTCAHANLVTSKVGALAVLRGIVGREPFDADLEMQNEPGIAPSQLGEREAVHGTIAEAVPVRVAKELGGAVEVEDVHETLPPSLQALTQHALRAAAQRRDVVAGPSGTNGTGPGGGFLPGKSMLFTE